MIGVDMSCRFKRTGYPGAGGDKLPKPDGSSTTSDSQSDAEIALIYKLSRKLLTVVDHAAHILVTMRSGSVEVLVSPAASRAARCMRDSS